MQEKEGYAKREEFGYDRLYFYTRVLVLSVLLVFSIALFGHDLSAGLPWFILLVTVLVCALLVLGISPLLTSHWLTRTRLIIRRGWYFRAIIPLREVASVGIYDGEPRLGLALSTYSSILFVTSRRHDLVEVKLKQARRFASVLGFSASRLVFNVDRPAEFLSAIKRRLASLSPVEPEGPDS